MDNIYKVEGGTCEIKENGLKGKKSGLLGLVLGGGLGVFWEV